ncbi:MAG TPA: DEAD/DEAH box helicase [Deltaproteobacteria bacterium]|nr:DEAD/DEAH box helicase [Deltaproteobacteria bacterium]HOI08154.1 DEAD/DEAH box helicase [Deltaproteobacteria bacterium]
MIHIDNALRVLESDLAPETVKRIEADLTLPNPKWEQVERYNRSRRRNFQPEMLEFFQRESGVLLLPRGYINHLLNRMAPSPYMLVDRTRMLEPVEFEFRADLHPYQAQAVRDLTARRFGVLEAPPGAGKTVIALSIIARRKQPALVIVHTKELMYQWHRRATEFLDLTEDEVGLIGDGHKRVGSRLTIAIINSLYKCIDEVKPSVGHLIVDECHHIPSRTFTDVVGTLDTAYMLGLSATPYRRDKLTRIIYFYLGDRLHRIQPRQLQAIDRIMKATLTVRHTRCAYYFDSDEYQSMISALIADKKRNALIADDVVERARSGRGGIALVISDRVAHCEELCRIISARGPAVSLLTGAMSTARRSELIEQLNKASDHILVATAQLIGEGFDLKALNSIFLATPIKFTGRVKQYIGRILRISEGKQEAVIYDYVDENGILRSSFHSRLVAYEDLGVRIVARSAQ